MYRKEESDLEPLLSGKVTDDCHIVGKDNVPLTEDALVKPGSNIRVMIALGSLFFKSDNQCRLITKVAKIQVVEEGEDHYSSAAGR